MAHINTASGRVWDLLAPHPRDICWRDVAEHLGKINRFNGATRGVTYSVAQHSCLVHDHLGPQEAAYGLLHDAHEFAIGDLTTPTKRALQSLGAQFALARLEETQDSAIFRAAGLVWPVPERIAWLVKRADLTALATEVRDLLAGSFKAEIALPPPWPERIDPWAWDRAAREWSGRFVACCPAEARPYAVRAAGC